jgi:hypothetical protein
VRRLRSLAIPALARMYLPQEKLFVFRLRLTADGIIPEGISRRYTAIALMGLALEEQDTIAKVLGGDSIQEVCARSVRDVASSDNLGDVALLLWATQMVGYPDPSPVRKKLFEFRPAERAYPIVELAWALSALCGDKDPASDPIRDALATRLLEEFGPNSGVFPHLAGERLSGLRSHVACFADLVYPVQALSFYLKLTGNSKAREAALRCAELFCGKQGPDGQWWWHYDWRTGDVIEPYPVYAIHQDAMAPMALFALSDATGHDFSSSIEKGLDWLRRSPELGGGSLIDDDVTMIWRKVARREPRKMTRTLQALASRVHPRLRAPGLDIMFPVGTVDYEDRPYHLGWLFYAWPASRIAQWEEGGAR